MYLLDANVFIEAKNRYFGFDICPGFWSWIAERHAAGTVFSIEGVRAELARGSDELSRWATARPPSFFLSPDTAALPHFASLSQWAANPQQGFTQPAVSVFLAAADYSLVAQAKALSYTVVTHERPDPFAKKRILIPNACQALAVSFISPIEFMRSEGLRLVLDSLK